MMQPPSPFPPFDPDGKPEPQQGRRSPIPLGVIVPNIITILAICAGLSGIRLAFEHRFEAAVIMVLIAAFLDGVDGRIARMMNGTSRFGAQMDSLADVVNFGVAPALVLYSYVLDQAHQIGWTAAMIYCIACCLRLARFNIMLDDENSRPAWQRNYFIGVPAPAGALVLLLPVYLGFLGVPASPIWAYCVSAYTVAIAFLMISRLPVYSGKTLGSRIRHDIVIPILLVIVAYFGLLVSYTWQTLTFTAFLFLLFLPLSLHFYKKHEQNNDE